MGSGGWGGGGGGEWGGGEDSFSLVFENSIVLIKCTLYDTVFQRQVSICRGVVFSYSFSIYCAAYHGIWCSACLRFSIHVTRTQLEGRVSQNIDIGLRFCFIVCKRWNFSKILMKIT